MVFKGLSNGLASRRSIDRKSPRRGRVVRKRLSAEEKLIEDNRAYYKVEVLNSKLRSTGIRSFMIQVVLNNLIYFGYFDIVNR